MTEKLEPYDYMQFGGNPDGPCEIPFNVRIMIAIVAATAFMGLVTVVISM